MSTAIRDSSRPAAVVLAAGFSSRMGSLKPLLPLGRAATAVERVVVSLRAAGIARVITVTGHEANAVRPVLERLGVEQAHNPAYKTGMFSSVRTGVAALPRDLDAFFVLPVDCPLVTPRVLRLLLDHFEGGGKGIIYPACLGRRGHPPLLAARYAELILAAEPDGNLQAFLGAHADDESEIDVRDLTALMDMDTPADYRSLARFAQALDAAVDGPPSPGAAPGAAPAGAPASSSEPSLTEEDALYLLSAAGTPPNVIRHCRTAAAVGEALTAALQPRVPALDVALVRAGCLLHDIARLHPHHARLAAELLERLGFPRLGAVVGKHMVIDPGLPRQKGLTEAELVYLSDKMVADGEVVGLIERQARTMRNMRPDPQTAERVAGRIQEARTIAAKVEAALGQPVDEELRGLALPPEAGPGRLQVYLVRHAHPEGPEGKRYRGQQDPPLSARGEEQARHLAARLTTRTGGACFDAVLSSDLERCRRTAEIVTGECATPVQAHSWLREIDVGLWEGLTWEEARERHPAEHAAREADLIGTPFPGGESFADLRDRVVAGFDRLLEESLAAGHRRILVVGHKGVNRVLLAHVRGAPLAGLFSIEQDYCAVTVLEVDAGTGRPYFTSPAISNESTLM